MPALLLSSHRKYYGVILVFPGHTPLSNFILVQMSHPGGESLNTSSISSLFPFKVLPNHSFLKSIIGNDPKPTKMNGIRPM